MRKEIVNIEGLKIHIYFLQKAVRAAYIYGLSVILLGHSVNEKILTHITSTHFLFDAI